MSVRYVRVRSLASLFAPAVRAFGNIAVVGKITPPQQPPPDLVQVGVAAAFTDPAEARERAPGELGDAVALAFAQSPGPSLVTAVRVAEESPNWQAALDVVAGLDVQLVVLANTPLTATTGDDDPEGPVRTLVNHVDEVSSSGGDGKQRMGVAMLAKDSADPTIVTGGLASERMVYIAHRSDQDAAAAVAGAIAGHEPHVSLLLKQVAITSPSFTQAQIATLNGEETPLSGPAGHGVNWLTSPAVIPGSGVYLGEGYTGNPGGKKFIDIVRTLDDISFRFNARLIKSIGDVRISRSGLRALVAQVEAILAPEVQRGVLNGFEVVVPLLVLLDKQPETLTAAEVEQISQAQARRVVEIMVAAEYAATVHRFTMSVKLS